MSKPHSLERRRDWTWGKTEWFVFLGGFLGAVLVGTGVVLARRA